MPEGALSDLKVLDLTQSIAGPYCTKLLGGLGATVVKVEKPNGGDPLRTVGPFHEDIPDPDRGFPFLYFNTDKQGITLNIKSATGAAIFKRLTEWADIVVENFRPGTMEKYSLGYDELEKINPGLTMISISNFGQTGPYRDYELTDITAQALGGLMIMVGEPDREPLALGASQALCAAGVAAFTAAMTGILARSTHGVGQHVDVSIFEMMAYTEWHATAAYAHNGTVRRRRGRMNPNRILRASDGYMGVWTTWPRVKELMEGALDDPRFATAAGREEHTEDLAAAMESWLMTRTKAEAYHQGQAMGQPWGYVSEMEDLLHSPQYAARSYLKEMAHPVVGTGTYARTPFRLGEVPDGPWQPAPRLGEHNAQVYGALLGYNQAELVRLREAGVI